MDFTLRIYKDLIIALKNAGYYFCTFSQYLRLKDKLHEKCVILRHDVDRLPLNSLQIGRIQAEKGISSTYYFRIVKQSFQPDIIKELSGLGHEIGYHYEDLERNKGNVSNAIKDFEKNLKLLRSLVPVDTICMHGSPLSKFDNRSMWSEHDYRDFNISGEPYFDLDREVFSYLTDTGRRWNATASNLRDKMNPDVGYSLRSTKMLIRAIVQNDINNRMMLTFHPQRWTDKPVPWLNELVTQNFKNIAKRALSELRGTK